VDELVGPERRDEFIEMAIRNALRGEAIKRLEELGKRFRGLTLEDIYYPSRRELEGRL
jgi:hypothetical protein